MSWKKESQYPPNHSMQRTALRVAAGAWRCDQMRIIERIAISLCVCLLLCSCSSQNNTVDLPMQVSEHEARNFANWQALQKKPLADRILPAPDLLLDYLRLDNKLNGYTGVPKAPEDGQSFASDVRAVIAELPDQVQKHLQEHVVGVFLVTDLGSTAYSDALRDFQTHKSGFIVLDVTALSKTANAWATWREVTPFEMSPEVTLEVRIADELQNDHRLAISFILLHELGHLVGAASESHALWWTGGNPSAYPFSALSWKAENGRVASRWDTTFSDRDKVQFYARETSRLPAQLAHRIYSQLLNTDFVSLYASTSVYEDFAETYAMYVHVVMQDRPWALKLQSAGKDLVEFAELIGQDRCKEKREYISRLMQEESQQ